MDSLFCEVCGGTTPVAHTRCTNGRCLECHAHFCTSGGSTSPGHARRYPVVRVARSLPITKDTKFETCPILNRGAWIRGKQMAYVKRGTGLITVPDGAIHYKDRVGEPKESV